MIFLIFNIVFASAFTLSVKLVHVRQREDVVTVAAISYIVSAILVAPEFFASGTTSSSTAAILSGAAMGASYFVAFFFFSYAIKSIGAASTTVVPALSMLIPIFCGVFIWSERPNAYQIVGIALAILSLTLITGRRPSRDAKPDESLTHVLWWLLPLVMTGLFVLGGASRLAQDTFKHLASPDQRPTYLWSAFVVAAIPSLVVLISRRQPIRRSEIAIGLLMGASNILQTHFILKSLEFAAGYIVFPVVSAGSLILTVVVATGLLGERISRRSLAGISVAIVALVLLNLQQN